MEKTCKRWGDRKDGTLLRNLDSMHYIVPLIHPNRCDNEAYISETIDLTAIQEYLDRKNAGNTDFPYTMFHLIVTALLRTITLRPELNRFIANRNMYQRNHLSASFVVKKQFSDTGAEGLAFLYAKDTDNVDTIHEMIRRQVQDARKGGSDGSTDSMDLFNKMPRFFSRFIVDIIRVLDVHGKVPQSLIASDPYYSSVILSNLGSIKLKCGYHHLTNWGTNSLFVIIGEKRMMPVYDEAGQVTMRPAVDLGLTADERLADGYYYSRSIRLLKRLLQEPELLEQPLNQEIDYD